MSAPPRLRQLIEQLLTAPRPRDVAIIALERHVDAWRQLSLGVADGAEERSGELPQD